MATLRPPIDRLRASDSLTDRDPFSLDQCWRGAVGRYRKATILRRVRRAAHSGWGVPTTAKAAGRASTAIDRALTDRPTIGKALILPNGGSGAVLIPVRLS